MAEAVVAAAGDELDLWLLPTLQFTKSNEHAWSPGTVWLSASTLLSVIDDVARCVAMTPAQRLVFLNGHGGNSALLNVALREVRLNHGLKTFLTHPGMPADQGGVVTGRRARHGRARRDRRDVDDAPPRPAPRRHGPGRAAGAGEARGEPAGALRRAVSFGWLSNDFFPDGYIGDPTAATAERGAMLFEGAVRTVCDGLREVATFDFGR